MDSLTQAVLGASVAGVCAPSGQRRKALLVGAALGTLPDLDVFIDYGDAVKNLTYHRGFSHSLFVLAPFSVLLWLALRRWWAPVRGAPVPWLAAISLALLTHPLLDAHTAYGTQLFWPMAVPPTMWGTIFIIDPLYTLPLLVGVLGATFAAKTVAARKFLLTGVTLSTAYLGWTWVAQSIVSTKVDSALAADGMTDVSVFITPTPLNTLLWRIVVQTESGYLEGFESLVADENSIDFRSYESDRQVLLEADNVWAVRRLRWFSSDFLKASVREGRLILTDLRMGQEPMYVFTHVVAEYGNPHWKAIPTEHIPIKLEDRALEKTWQRIWTSQD
jgi:inner membrane protein